MPKQDLPPLGIEEFDEVFRAVHGHPPYRWQQRLLEQVARDRRWPAAIVAPTGAGKTAVLDVALFHLALEVDQQPRRAPLRIVFAVDRRIIVDQAFERACRIHTSLAEARTDSALGRMATRLSAFSDDRPLHVAELRGGMPLERSWARRPDQPTILCTTIDQLGSRLLFRGYGITTAMAPVHAGLLANDALLLLDEAHLSLAFENTLNRIAALRSSPFERETPFAWTSLTATPFRQGEQPFELTDGEKAEEAVKRRLDAQKPVRLVAVGNAGRPSGKGEPAEAHDAPNQPDLQGQPRQPEAQDEAQRVEALIEEARHIMDRLIKEGTPAPVVAVVVNRVMRARAVLDGLRSMPQADERDAPVGLDSAEAILLTGRVRPIERDALVEHWRPRLEGRATPDAAPLFVVATQCIEAGADFDFDGMVTDLAPLDALRQRFGRLARSGNRNGRPAPGAIIAGPERDDKRGEDPLYGGALAKTWAWLESVAQVATGHGNTEDVSPVDFGASALDRLPHEKRPPPEACTPRPAAPLLREVDVDALAMTSPPPFPDPPVPMFLHGENRDAGEVAIVWRRDLEDLFARETSEEASPDNGAVTAAQERLALLPPRPAEALRLPIWQARAWLCGQRPGGELADIPMPEPKQDGRQPRSRRALRWAGPDNVAWVTAQDVRPGDTLIVPASYGGCDSFGWAPESTAMVVDLGERAAVPWEGRRAVMRFHPALWPPAEGFPPWAQFIGALGDDPAVREVLAWLEAEAKAAARADFAGRLERWRKGRGVRLVRCYGEEIAAGFALLADRGLPDVQPVDDEAVTEADEGSFGHGAVSLDRHHDDVAREVEGFARRLGLNDRVHQALVEAARAHDAGKADPRFQRFLELVSGRPNSGEPLAKSGRRPPPGEERVARARARLPQRFRHEALSVRWAAAQLETKKSNTDLDLVLWLIGTHHGFGRPFFPHDDPWDDQHRELLGQALPAGAGPNRLDFDWRGYDWPGLMQQLQKRYGVWGLAFLEACLRLADHRASALAEARPGGLG